MEPSPKVHAHGPHIQSLLTTYEHHLATWYMLAIHARDLDPQSKAHAHDPCKHSFLFSWHLEIFVFVFVFQPHDGGTQEEKEWYHFQFSWISRQRVS